MNLFIKKKLPGEFWVFASVVSLLGSSPASASIPILSVSRVFLLTKLKLRCGDSHTFILTSHLTFVPCPKSLKGHFFFHYVIIKLNRLDHAASSLLFYLHGEKNQPAKQANRSLKIGLTLHNTASFILPVLQGLGFCAN